VRRDIHFSYACTHTAAAIAIASTDQILALLHRLLVADLLQQTALDSGSDNLEFASFVLHSNRSPLNIIFLFYVEASRLTRQHYTGQESDANPLLTQLCHVPSLTDQLHASPANPPALLIH